ncbi:hypothetical protein [Spartinivicinus ruber]|uniref:hypothetical protein n=1 Tax=Spartinivicinus ruber TaxID=2683272 RepID=UPI0013D48B16|nr:hypothetical protein [Spartinivicinus ruber]
MKKPTGKAGFTRLSFSDGTTKQEFNKINYSDNKEEIELHIVHSFIKTGRDIFKNYFFISNPNQNQQDDFDFTVQTPRGDAYLEMMEVAPLEYYKTNYKNAPNTYKAGDIAEFVFSKIKSKSDKYPNNLTEELFLLLYITDYKFHLSDSTIYLISYFCYKATIKFDVVFLYTPLDGSEGVINWVHPIEKEDFNSINLNNLRNNKVYNIDPEAFIKP